MYRMEMIINLRVAVIDHYERSAEFIDIMMAPHWPSLGPPLARALSGSTGPVVDVGAGGGLGTRVIAEALPEAEILAVEPSPALRSVLLARVNEAADLRERVTVIPEGFLEARLPERLGAVVMMNVIGHFDPTERRKIWGLLRERGAKGVVNLQPPTESIEVPETRFADISVGRRRYEGWGRAEPAAADRLTWHMTYRTYQDGRLVCEAQVSYPWWVITAERLEAELGEYSLKVDAAELGMYVID
jgi:SAM-dependent methyltransferase